MHLSNDFKPNIIMDWSLKVQVVLIKSEIFESGFFSVYMIQLKFTEMYGNHI